MKKLYRSEENKIVFGILGGLGDYYDVDPAFIRFIYIILMFATGIIPLTIAYFVGYFVVPKRNSNEKRNQK